MESQSSDSRSPLSVLADEIIRLSEICASTPVLVTPAYLSLRHAFFVELVDTITKKTNRPVRVDWYRESRGGIASLIGDFWATRQATSINRDLSKRRSKRRFVGSSARPSVQVTAAVGKTRGNDSDLVVGVCQDQVNLPRWTTAIRLGGSRNRVFDLQSAL